MKILAVGGGSGGHVTPVVAVLKEIRRKYPEAELRFWCDRKFEKQARSIMGDFDKSIRVDAIVSGKLRRYNHLNLWQQLIKLRTIVLPNVIDTIKAVVGMVQSLFKLVIWRPDVVFAKGGFVCLPVGLAAWLLRIPLVIHDSDAHPGLTNRILARFAASIGTGAPLKFYPYPVDRARYVGVPVRPEFVPYTNDQQQLAKQTLGFDVDKTLMVVTGGGLGSQRLNEAIVSTISELVEHINVILITGKTQYEPIRKLIPQDTTQYHIVPFISEGMADMLGAADIVVARAGATTILELAALAKPTILVPNSFLTGGHQLKNAAVYAESGVVRVIDELALDANPEILVQEVADLLANRGGMEAMGQSFHQFARPDAAKDMAELIISAANR